MYYRNYYDQEVINSQSQNRQISFSVNTGTICTNLGVEKMIRL